MDYWHGPSAPSSATGAENALETKPEALHSVQQARHIIECGPGKSARGSAPVLGARRLRNRLLDCSVDPRAWPGL
eukprot:2020823-Pyramimonas_sp.AAC.1